MARSGGKFEHAGETGTDSTQTLAANAQPTRTTGRLGRWHIVGAGRIGTLAAHYLQRAGAEVCVLRPGAPGRHRALLDFGDRRRTVTCPQQPPADCASIARLLVATKTPYTAAALARLDLADDTVVLRLQNGLGSLDGLLRPGQRLIEAVTESAVMGDNRRHLRVVAENTTVMGGGPPPDWFTDLATAWPGLAWRTDPRHAQWRKLVANAAINPLTALHDLPNGALVENRPLRRALDALVDEADNLLARLDPHWPAASRAPVAAIAAATAANTSSMRADVLAGAPTEIDAINGWLLARARVVGLDLPHHRRIVARIKALA